LTVPLLFLLVQPFVGVPAALVASLLLATVALFCAAVAFHQLGILAAIWLPIPLVFIGWSRVSTVALLALSGVSWLTAQYYNQFVGGNFSRWARSMGLDGSAPLEDKAAPLAALPASGIALLALVQLALAVIRLGSAPCDVRE
jgi:hypothetical protein